MEGRFKKIDLRDFSFEGGGGLYCNNSGKDLAFRVMRDKFGRPNGNRLRLDISTWKYVLSYEGVFLTVYDYGDLWSVGFVELVGSVCDYEITRSFSRMLFNYLQAEIGIMADLLGV